MLNGTTTTYPAPAGGFTRVAVFARGGNDWVNVADALARPAYLDGGTGNDTLIDGGGYDRIVNPGENGGLSLNSFGPDLGVEEIAGAAGFSDQHVEGTSGTNVLNFGQAKLTNLLYVDGRSGNDVITASAVTSGMRYVGGGGGDTFAVTAAAAGTEAVLDDFRSGTDKIDLRALGVTYADLTFVPSGADRLVRIQLAGGGVITLRLKNFSGNPPASDVLFT